MGMIDHIYQSGCLDHSSLTQEQAEAKRMELRRAELEEQLREELTETGRKLFEEYDECRTTLTVLYGQTEFVNGFRCGGTLAAEMLIS